MQPILTSTAKARKARLGGALLAAAALLLLASAAWAAVTPAVDWWVMASGGGHAEAGSYTLDGTLGQAVVGPSSGGPYELSSGYWFGRRWEPSYWIYVPLITRDTK